MSGLIIPKAPEIALPPYPPSNLEIGNGATVPVLRDILTEQPSPPREEPKAARGPRRRGVIMLYGVLIFFIGLTALSWYQFDYTPGIAKTTGTVYQVIPVSRSARYRINYQVWYNFTVNGHDYHNYLEKDIQSYNDLIIFNMTYYNGSTLNIYYLADNPDVSSQTLYHVKSDVWYRIGIASTILMIISLIVVISVWVTWWLWS